MRSLGSLLLTLVLSVFALPQANLQPEFIKQGQQLMREGKLDDALALYNWTTHLRSTRRRSPAIPPRPRRTSQRVASST